MVPAQLQQPNGQAPIDQTDTQTNQQEIRKKGAPTPFQEQHLSEQLNARPPPFHQFTVEIHLNLPAFGPQGFHSL